MTFELSIVMPVFNGERYLRSAVESVLNQTFDDWELLFIDDGSTDGSIAICNEFVRQHPKKIRILSHPNRENRGQFTARILGASRARADTIALLDQDDIWLPTYLADHVRIWREVQSENVRLSYGPFLRWFSDDPTGGKDSVQTMPPGGKRVHAPGALLTHFLESRLQSTPAPSCALIRRDVFAGVSKFEKLARRSAYEDQYLWWYTAARWPVSVHCDAWVKYRQHSQSAMFTLSASARKSYLNEVRFLRAIKRDLREANPVHELLQRSLLADSIRKRERTYYTELLRSRLPRSVYRAGRFLAKLGRNKD